MLENNDPLNQLYTAIWDNNVKLLNQAIETLKNSDRGKKTLSRALIVAARDVGLDVVQELIAVKGIDFYAKDRDDDTALIAAVRNGRLDVVQAFIAKLKNSKEGIQALSEALIIAVRFDRLPVVQAFIAKLKNSKEGIQALSEALIEAVTLNKLDIVKALLAVNGIELNAQDVFGKTALAWAEGNKNTDIVSLLKTRAESIKQENLDRSSAPLEGSTDDVGDTEPTDTRPIITASSAGPEGFNSGQAKPEQDSSTASTNTSESGGSATSGTEVGRDTPKAKSIKQENLDSSSAPLEGSTDDVGDTEPTDNTRPIITASSAGPEGFNSGRAKPEQDSSTVSTNTSESGGSAISGAGAHSTDNSDPTTFENVISDNTSDEELESSKKPGPYPNKQQLLTCLASTATCTAGAYGLFVQGAFPVMWGLYPVLAGGAVFGAVFALMLIRSVKVGGDDVARNAYDQPETQPEQQYQI
jgi:hypothetical protein